MAGMLLTPEEFARAWGAEPLVQLPSPLATAPIPDDAREFLVRAGLPALIRHDPETSERALTFCRLASGLVPLLGERESGRPPWPPEWSVYWVMGDEFYCQGGANWCVHASTGCVYRIDLDIDPPVEFANSSVAHFASALHAALVWSGRASRSSTAWPSEVDRLKRELAELDPPCMQSDGNAWAWYLEHIREEGPHLGAFEKGSRSEGERALQAGPW